MKTLGTVIAIALFVGVLVALIFGLHSTWQYLSNQWSLVDDSWKPVVIITSSVMIFCSLIIIIAIQSAIRSASSSSLGKSNAYSNYLNWYAEVSDKDFNELNLGFMQSLRNEMLLWAGNHVMKQFNQLHTELNLQDTSIDNIKKYARHVYIEIQRDLGRRGTDKLRMLN